MRSLILGYVMKTIPSCTAVAALGTLFQRFRVRFPSWTSFLLLLLRLFSNAMYHVINIQHIYILWQSNYTYSSYSTGRQMDRRTHKPKHFLTTLECVKKTNINWQGMVIDKSEVIFLKIEKKGLNGGFTLSSDLAA